MIKTPPPSHHSPRLAFVGAGRLGRTLARACAARGADVVAVASRSTAAAEELAAQLPACQALSPEQAVEAADWVFLTVSDDAIASLADRLPWRSAQLALHCSGATELSALAAATRAGAQTAGFHPLQIFSDPARAEHLLAGSTVAIELGSPDADLQQRLHDLADRLGMRPLQLPPGSRAAYHAAASYSASFLLSMLDEAAQLWAEVGLPESAALSALLPLARGTLDAAEARGLSGALSGPISRGDLGVVATHLQALDAMAGDHGAFYRQLAQRQLRLARLSGRLDEAGLQDLQTLIKP
ncbi:Rossmann-like and DUF2520 domain-containing protein [Paucibacter sp. Y2R2-4]|uniref:Rossmann-like and DUF2520 domain-containing protein n=1 Tax=Paucibacter sp. Y2R2-4 TaxID=2893553 RepID=UPI0021E474D6|nr:DUF2520 domain-containing protein [Paucibacter sp. Y2R2-4]MCV2350115.1 DUF2520 domain-containing protein [Paucibacter sp. Y2R2-4]